MTGKSYLSKNWRVRRAAHHGRALLIDCSGQALVEAALIFPILIGLFLGVSEFSQAFTVKRRLELAANTSADLVAREKTVSSADLNGIKAMVNEMIKPYPSTTLGVTITSVVADGANTTRVAWSYAQGNGAAARPSGTTVSLPSGLTQPNSSIIFAEIQYTFRSTLTTMIVGDVAFHAEAYLRPRLIAQVAKTN